MGSVDVGSLDVGSVDVCSVDMVMWWRRLAMSCWKRKVQVSLSLRRTYESERKRKKNST